MKTQSPRLLMYPLHPTVMSLPTSATQMTPRLMQSFSKVRFICSIAILFGCLKQLSILWEVVPVLTDTRGPRDQ